jgi:hypothetical protein
MGPKSLKISHSPEDPMAFGSFRSGFINKVFLVIFRFLKN